MYCRFCGNQVPEQAIVCINCGCSPFGGKSYCQFCGSETNQAAQVCVKCGVKLWVSAPYAKSKIAAGLLGIFLGGIGLHRFYLGYTGIGIAQILVTLFTFGLGAIWGFVEGILILAGIIDRDADGRLLRD